MSETIVLNPTDPTVKPLIYSIRETIRSQGKYAAYVEAHNVTRDNVKDHALALAAVVFPKDEPVQKKDGKRTRFGNAVQAAGNGLRGALDKGDPEQAATDYLAAVVKAAEKATAHDITVEQIKAALDALG